MNKFQFFCLNMLLMISACSLSPGLISSTAVPPTDVGITAVPPTMVVIEKTQAPILEPTPLEPVKIDRGDELFFVGDYQAAKEIYQQALNTAVDIETQAAAFFGLGKSQYMTADYLLAVQTFLTLLENYQLEYYTLYSHYYLAQSYVGLKKYELAADSYADFLKEHNGSLADFIHQQRGDTLFAAGKYKEAISAYQASLATSTANGTTTNIQIAKAYEASGDTETALAKYWEVYYAATNDYIKAQMNLLMGNLYLEMGQNEQAYARFQDSVINYPLAYDAYTGLFILVKNEEPVDDLYRGLVDYYAGKYGVALDALNRYIKNNPGHDGTPALLPGAVLAGD